MKRIPYIYSQRGVSIGEILLVILLMSILAMVMVPRFNDVSQDAKYEACRTNVANINALVQLYYIKEATWPLTNLSDIGADDNYFPEGLPSCPVTTTETYTIFPTGHRVTGHARGDPTHP